MKKVFLIIQLSLITGIALAVFWNYYQNNYDSISKIQISNSSSQLFTEREIKIAANTVVSQFRIDYPEEQLISLSYIGDLENLKSTNNIDGRAIVIKSMSKNKESGHTNYYKWIVSELQMGRWGVLSQETYY